MNNRPIHLLLSLIALHGVSCRRTSNNSAPQPNDNRVQPGPNALDQRNANNAPGRPQRVALAVGVTEGRIKPPDDKPNDDEERYRVRPEWYPTGQPNNPYPAGTMIPINPPTPGMQPVPMQPGMQPGLPSLQPIPAPGAQPTQNPALQPFPMPTGMQPQPGLPSLQPIPAPGQPGTPAMQPLPTPGAPTAPAPGVAPQAQTFNGTLGPDAERTHDGRFMRVHNANFRRGQRVSVLLQSAQFDTLLRVEPPTGEAVENDDVAQNDTNSRVDFTAPIDGRYRVVVTSYGPGMQGAYTLQTSAGEPGQGMVVVGNGTGADAQTGPGGTLVAGAPVNEYLTPGDPSSGGRYVRTYRLNGQQGDMVNLRLESSAFDPTLALVAPNGQRWSNDDTSQADTNSTINVALPAAGEYRVEVSSYRAGATGPFSLTVSSSARPTVGPGGAPVGSVAGRRAQGAMYGVFVGITDYGGRGNLYGCADDARQLAQAYINAHLGAPQNFIVLTDAEATTDAVRNAFAQMSQRVGPNDVFMFFHSGHGNRRPASDRRADPDGFTETIVLRDAEIDSHAMSAMFDNVRADVNMLALDSCYSGGFERAFGSSPSRFGLYSSEEDVLSQVAQRYQAGGYLSYFLRRGVTEGDNNHDGSLRAGELADYLYRQYAENRSSMGTEDGSGVNTWQNLRVSRAGVALSDMLWRFPATATRM